MRYTRSLFVAFAIPTIGLAADWKPIDPLLLQLKTPRIEKDADAEALFWEVRVMDEARGSEPYTTLWHYLRVKIYTERGRDSQSSVELHTIGKTTINGIAGRTIKPDGTIVELRKDAIFDKNVAKANGLRVRAKSFAMPAVEPGAIIEYQWRETRDDQLANYARLYFQRDIPVWQVKYYVKPLSHPYFPYGMRTRGFQVRNSPFVREPNGFYSTSMDDVPAFREESRMPPEDQVKAWMLVYYSEDKKLMPDKFWREHGKDASRFHKQSIKVNDDIKRTAESVIGDASKPLDKLGRLAAFCRTSIKNIYHESSGLTAEQRADLKDNRTTADTLKAKAGTGYDINLLFAALATAAGFDARLAKLSDRSDTFFDRNFPDPYFLRTSNIAVNVEGTWHFFDPASPYVPTGMLRWQEEGVEALICDPKEPLFVRTPFSGPEKSLQHRTGKFTLDEDGTLEGEILVEIAGHNAVRERNYQDGFSEAQRIQNFKEQLQARMSTAEASDIKIENLTDTTKPFVYSYRVKIPGYAQRTGRRLFVQPAYFQFNRPALFRDSVRRHDIYFDFSYSEHDEIEIRLPEGYSLDNAEAPQSSRLAHVGDYSTKLFVKDGRTLLYSRTFVWGNEGNLLFRAESYPQLKKIFDFVHSQDNHAVTLKYGPPSKPGGAE